jgi:hypothetical protein
MELTKYRDSHPGRIIASLDKEKSPRQIDFVINPEDEEDGDKCFVEMIEFQKKTQEIKYWSLIRMKDVEGIIEKCIRLRGYKKMELL